ncbi:helix-turn-helix transcriptional regulator [Corynebacterium hindlerae]|uniref:helix-turn-helix transcriptional regulator n=1 Tax=Corynebacterium hindlerae TaxID=699041 RepID=UPI001AD6E46D|nr:helix-turn-helix transcriptional regulator [Corynebacterium hindlerae]QTH60086.1 helix-turn-helix transcriptional regulator [Corynebacterium hindlerae]
MNNTIAQKLKEQRTQKGMSQADLAAELQKQGIRVHQTAIAKIESGSRRLEAALAMRIADTLDLDWQELHIAQESTHDQALGHTIKATRATLNAVEYLNTTSKSNADTLDLLHRAITFAQLLKEQSADDYGRLGLDVLKTAATELVEALQHVDTAISPAVDVAGLARHKLEALNTHLATSNDTE